MKNKPKEPLIAGFRLLSRKEKLQVTLTMLTITACLVGGLYWVGMNAEREGAERKTALNKGSQYGKGIISSIHYYKGHTVSVKYKVDGKNYECQGGWDHNPKHLGKTDSISFRYATSDPSLIITELENEY